MRPIGFSSNEMYLCGLSVFFFVLSTRLFEVRDYIIFTIIFPWIQKDVNICLLND